MKITLAAALCVFILLCLLQELRIRRARRYLEAGALVTEEDIKTCSMHVLVPLFREQAILDEIIYNFSQLARALPSIEITFITTARECQEEGLSTHALLMSKLGAAHRLRLLRCPNLTGTMATQLNYGVRHILESNERGCRFAVFNADSVIPPESLVYADSELKRNPAQVLQQHAYYVLRDRARNSLLMAQLASWQTRWSLQFELGRLLATCNPNIFHYVIGHGLYLTSETWERADGFSDQVVCEDAFLSIMLFAQRIPIRPVPYLERADFAPSIAAYLKQQAVWFCGPLYAFAYAKRLSQSANAKPLNLRRTYFGAIQLQLHSLYWVTGPIAQGLIVPAIMLSQNTYDMLALWIATAWWFNYRLNRRACEVVGTSSTLRGGLDSVVAAFAAYFLHCVGPIIALLRALVLQNRTSNKYKTDRV